MVLKMYSAAAMNVYNKVKIVANAAIDADCDKIYKATTGLGTDEDVLVSVIGTRNANERATIAGRYEELYNISLRELVKSEAGGAFGYLLQMCCMDLPHTESFILYHAVKGFGLGVDESLIYPVVLGRSNEELAVLKKTFFAMYNLDLAATLGGALSGDYKAIIMAAIQEPLVEYKSSFHSADKAKDDANLLYKSGEGKWGTDEEPFIKVLLSSPSEHLAHVSQEYEAITKHSLLKAIDNEFGGVAATALKYYVQVSLEPMNALAELAESTMAGIGTDEKALSSFVMRYHPYLNRVKQTYQTKFKTTLRERIAGENSGKYGELLLKVFDTPDAGQIA